LYYDTLCTLGAKGVFYVTHFVIDIDILKDCSNLRIQEKEGERLIMKETERKRARKRVGGG